MSQIGARIQRQKRAESKAARSLIRSLLAEARPEPSREAAAIVPWHEETPARRALASTEGRALFRWALFVALILGGLAALAVIERC